MSIGLADGFEPLSERPRRLYDIWNRWRGDRQMPARRDVLPEELRDLLPYIPSCGPVPIPWSAAISFPAMPWIGPLTVASGG